MHSLKKISPIRRNLKHQSSAVAPQKQTFSIVSFDIYLCGSVVNTVASSPSSHFSLSFLSQYSSQGGQVASRHREKSAMTFLKRWFLSWYGSCLFPFFLLEYGCGGWSCTHHFVTMRYQAQRAKRISRYWLSQHQALKLILAAAYFHNSCYMKQRKEEKQIKLWNEHLRFCSYCFFKRQRSF